MPKPGSSAPAASGSAIRLYAKAQTRFWRIFLKVALLRCSASSTYDISMICQACRIIYPSHHISSYPMSAEQDELVLSVKTSINLRSRKLDTNGQLGQALTWGSLSRSRTIAAASEAASTPPPMAMPRSATASALASFTPSPTMATHRPAACTGQH